ncbi:MAG: putative quorum-sensing-regulated virulence factor [Rhabdochlamydiaceae bacterium]
MELTPIYYDTETTGVKADKDRIIEIAAYNPIKNTSFCAFINPGMPIPKEATAIHNISDEMVKEAPSFEQVGLDFINFCGDNAVLIAHNNDAFDKVFLCTECKRHNLSVPDWLYVDTLKWSRKYRSDLPKHSLQYLREVYGLPANQAHRALDDVMILHQVFSLMIDDLPINIVIELLAENKPLLRMPFGKHQGKLFSEIPQDYISWLVKSGFFDKPDNENIKEAFIKAGKTI